MTHHLANNIYGDKSLSRGTNDIKIETVIQNQKIEPPNSMDPKVAETGQPIQVLHAVRKGVNPKVAERTPRVGWTWALFGQGGGRVDAREAWSDVPSRRTCMCPSPFGAHVVHSFVQKLCIVQKNATNKQQRPGARMVLPTPGPATGCRRKGKGGMPLESVHPMDQGRRSLARRTAIRCNVRIGLRPRLPHRNLLHCLQPTDPLSVVRQSHRCASVACDRGKRGEGCSHGPPPQVHDTLFVLYKMAQIDPPGKNRQHGGTRTHAHVNTGR